MPKRTGYIYEKMLDKELIKYTIIKGSRGKKKRHDVKKVLKDIEGYADKVLKLLETGTYVPTTPRRIRIRDASSGKERIISVVPYYPDGIIHQLCVEAMSDVVMRGMYHWSCASIPGRGNSRAAGYVRRALDRDPRGTKYCAKMDIRHFYPSVNRDLLMKALAHKIKDRRFLKLLEDIICSDEGTGLAIGFYLNQWLANYFLEPLDHFIARQDGVSYYVRNMDDLVLIGRNKKKLHKAVREIRSFLAKMELELKGNWQVFPVKSRGIDFVGYRFWTKHTALRRRNFLKLTRSCRKVQSRLSRHKRISFRLASGTLSRIGQMPHFDNRKVKEKYLAPGMVRILKMIVRKHSRELQRIKGGS